MWNEFETEVPVRPATSLLSGRDSSLSFPRVLEATITLTSCIEFMFAHNVFTSHPVSHSHNRSTRIE